MPILVKRSEHDLKNFPNYFEACDICNPVSNIFGLTQIPYFLASVEVGFLMQRNLVYNVTHVVRGGLEQPQWACSICYAQVETQFPVRGCTQRSKCLLPCVL